MSFTRTIERPRGIRLAAWLLLSILMLMISVGGTAIAQSPIPAPAPAPAPQNDKEKDTGHTVRKLPKHLMPKGVVSSYRRKTVDSKTHPWKTVGRVNIGGTAHCTGSLIADNIVLTAAHCLYSKPLNKMVAAKSVHFLAGYARGSYLAHSRVIAYETSSGFNGSIGSHKANAPHDWALLILQEPLGSALGVLPLHKSFGIAPGEYGRRRHPKMLLSTTEIAIAGYPRDRSHVLSLEENCALKNAFNGGVVLVITCTALKGDSGGPILQPVDGKWVLIGLQTAALQNGNIRYTLGVSALGFRRAFSALMLAKEAPAPMAAPGSE